MTFSQGVSFRIKVRFSIILFLSQRATVLRVFGEPFQFYYEGITHSENRGQTLNQIVEIFIADDRRGALGNAG